MRAITFPTLFIAAAAAATMTCAGCSSSGTSAGAPSGHSTGTQTKETLTITAGAAATPASAASGSGISITGAFAAKATITLCVSDIGSIAVHVDGDSETYRGSISARSLGFVGPNAADYSLKSGQAKPTVSASGTSFTVKDAELTDLVSGKTITATGTVSCP
ncbi:MAG: hypothetical protein ABI345_03115 [Jatrophihabitans sp.]